MKLLLISTHDDDSHLFACYTLLRDKPVVVVVTDGYIQFNRGDLGCSAEIRAEETRQAHAITGNPVIRLGIRDDTLTEEEVAKALRRFSGFDRVYAPAIQYGNPQHDIIGKVADTLWEDKVRHYMGYSNKELYTKGQTEIIPTEEEIELKNKALDCYQSQINLTWTAPHFTAVRNRSEWLQENSK